jgi:adenylylsulfate kinase
MVLWLIGLSGAGKTTLAQLVYNKLKPSTPNLVLLNGDVLRDVFGNDVDHTIEGRNRNANRLSHLSRFLANQNIHVIAAVLSIFPEWQQWNRANIPEYSEVYLRASLGVLTKRDKKGLYVPALRGEMENVVGVDIPFPEPLNADMVIDNNEERSDFHDMVLQIMSLSYVQKIV